MGRHFGYARAMKNARRLLFPLLLSAPLLVPLGSSLLASHMGLGKARPQAVALAGPTGPAAQGAPRARAFTGWKAADPEPESPEDAQPAPGAPSTGEAERSAPRDGMGRGMDLLGEGTRMILRGLLSEVQPLLEDLRGRIDELDAYHPPEVLPNGDILIRRRTAPDHPVPLPGTQTGPNGEVDL